MFGINKNKKRERSDMVFRKKVLPRSFREVGSEHLVIIPSEGMMGGGSILCESLNKQQFLLLF